MKNRSETIRQLPRQGPAAARQLADIIEISQLTLFRALKTLGDEVVRIGSGPSIQYALRDDYRGFKSVPVYRISEEGQVKLLGKLLPVCPLGLAYDYGYISLMNTSHFFKHSLQVPFLNGG